MIAIIALPIFILLIPSNIKIETPKELELDWQEKYASQTSGFQREYFIENEYYDYSSEIVQEVIKSIEKTTINEYDAIQKALDYVYYNVEYDYHESDQVCFDSTASNVLEKGIGQCDTQSIALIAILRGLGFAARPVGGCVYKNKLCIGIQSVFAEELRDPIYQTRNITKEMEELGYVSRGQEAPRKGGLHAWVEVYMPVKGWIILEATAGEIVEDSCYVYNVELYPKEKEDICVTKSIEYAQWCWAQ